MNQKSWKKLYFRKVKKMCFNISILLTGVLLAGMLLSAPAMAEDIAVPHRGEVFTAPPAVMPSSCKGFLAPFTCCSDPGFELALEQEYWDIVGNGHFEQLKDWEKKSRHYLNRVKGIPAASRARIEKLKAFGWVGEFVKDKMYDPANLPEVLYARYWSEQSRAHHTTPNTETINDYLRAYMAFALGNRDSGEEAIADLYQINETYGPVAGSEGELVGAMGLLLLSDEASVTRGMDTLQDCETFSCLRESVFAPYKYVGMQIAIAEGYARLGDFQKMEMAFDAARSYADQYNHPYPELIEYLHQELTKTGGVIYRWNASPNLALGDIKLPLPPSTHVEACQVCHASGRQTRQVYGDDALIEK